MFDLRPNLVSFWGRKTVEKRREEEKREEEDEEEKKKRRKEERKIKKVWNYDY